MLQEEIEVGEVVEEGVDEEGRFFTYYGVEVDSGQRYGEGRYGDGVEVQDFGIDVQRGQRLQQGRQEGFQRDWQELGVLGRGEKGFYFRRDDDRLEAFEYGFDGQRGVYVVAGGRRGGGVGRGVRLWLFYFFGVGVYLKCRMGLAMVGVRSLKGSMIMVKFIGGQ